jgi:hypothetical protein
VKIVLTFIPIFGFLEIRELKRLINFLLVMQLKNNSQTKMNLCSLLAAMLA